MHIYRHTPRQLFLISLLSFLFFIIFAKPIKAATVTDLMPSDLYTWYNANAWTAGNANYFGAYGIWPYEDVLYLGFSSGQPNPTDNNGAMLASFDGSSLTELGDIDEQGLCTMQISGDRVFVSGLDPTRVGHWEAGNLYIYDIGDATFSKLRYRYDDYQYVDATTTDANGNYSFAGLKRTAYMVKFILPDDYAFSTPQEDDVDYYPINSNANVTDGTFPICEYGKDGGVWMTGDLTDLTIDAGIYSDPGNSGLSATSGTKNEDFFTGDYTIGDLVWNDANEDGFQDDGEDGVEGVRVELYTKDPYFPCVLHNQALFVEDDGQTIYYNGGIAYSYDVTLQEVSYRFGYILYKSTDGGSTWSVVQENGYPLDSGGFYYSHNLFKFNGGLYEKSAFSAYDWTITGYLGEYARLGHSADDTTWEYYVPEHRFMGGIDYGEPYGVLDNLEPNIDRTQQFVEFRGSLLLPRHTGTELMQFTSGLTFTDLTVTGARFRGVYNSLDLYEDYESDYYYGISDRFQTFWVVNDEYLVAIGDDNKLYASTDIRTWVELADFSEVDSGAEAITVSYWPNQEKIIAATVGSNASIYSIPLSDMTGLFTTITNDTSLAFNDTDETSLNLKTIGTTGENNIQIRYNSYLLSELDVTFSGSSLDWSTVDGEVDVAAGKSYIKNLIGSTGAASTHDLYIPIPSSGGKDYAVVICPNPSSLSDITTICDRGVSFRENETRYVGDVLVTVTKETVDGQNYWKASGVDGTGGISIGRNLTATGAPICRETAPQGLSLITSAEAVTPTSLLLNFIMPTQNVTNYVLRFSTEKDNYLYGSLNIGRPGSNEYLVEHLAPRQTYHFQVIATNGCATGTWSNVYTYIPNAFSPIVNLTTTSLPTPTPTPTPAPQLPPSLENPTPPSQPAIWQRLLQFLNNLLPG